MNHRCETFSSKGVDPSTHDRQSARADKAIGNALKLATRWDIFMATTLMSLVSFSLPGRESPDGVSALDWVALAKLTIRLSVVAWFGSIVLVHRFTSLTLRAKRLGRPAWDLIGEFVWHGRWTDRLLLPWWCFAAWSLVTVAWSPRFSASLGQWLGLVGVLLFSQVISDRCANNKSFPWQAIAKQLNVVLAIYSLMVLTAHTISPGSSGLDRSLYFDGASIGLFHPTAVGATSSLGLTLMGILFLKRVIANTPVVLGTLALHTVVLYFSASRAALAIGCLAGLICFIFLMPQVMRASVLVFGGLGMLLLVILDPGFELASSRIRDVSMYVQRGQSIDQLRQVSGRAELWELIWEQFKSSPVIGHGYFVTSSTGKLDVWGGSSSEDAHNVGLQVLVSTGIVGGIIFLWALLVSVGHLISSLIAMLNIRVMQRNSSSHLTPAPPILAQQRIEGDFVSFVVIVAIWFLGWSQSCVSFLGPIRPEVVAFFAILGLVSAHARWVANCSSSHECAPS